MLALKLRRFLEGATIVYVSIINSNYVNMKKKAKTRTNILEKTIYSRSPDLILKELRTEQVRQIL